MFKTIYHIKDGPVSMYEIDARAALANFPKEWFDTEEAATAAGDLAAAVEEKASKGK